MEKKSLLAVSRYIIFGIINRRYILGYLSDACICISVFLRRIILKSKFGQIKNCIIKIQKSVLNKIVAVVLFTEYILIIIPTAILMKLCKRDRLHLKKYDTNSYWKTYKNDDVNYERQF